MVKDFFKSLLSINFICVVLVALYLYHHSRKFIERAHLEFEVEQQLTEKYTAHKSATEEE